MNRHIENLIYWLQSLNIPEFYADLMVRIGILAIVTIVALMSFLVAKKYFIRGLYHFIKNNRFKWDDVLIEKKVFSRLIRLVPAIVFYVGINLILPDFKVIRALLHRIILIYIIVIGFQIIGAVLDAFLQIYQNMKIGTKKPVRSYIQVIKILLYIIGTILAVSTLLDKSPWAFLSGLGALTAVVMLVFKDSILGFAASVQIAAYNLVQVGDWIEMPKYNADGDVIDISLNTIKVQNWDKTITTIPTYALISDSFKNWRGMSESGGRRIKRAIYIDMATIKFCTEEMILRFKKIQYIRDYVEKKKNEMQQYNLSAKVDESSMVNGRRMTNLGTFRAYIESYLRHHPKIHQEMTFLIRHLAPTSKGLPLEIYVFSNDQVWAHYEAIQADIFDHILAVVSEFDLRVFQEPSGSDMRSFVRAK